VDCLETALKGIGGGGEPKRQIIPEALFVQDHPAQLVLIASAAVKQVSQTDHMYFATASKQHLHCTAITCLIQCYC